MKDKSLRLQVSLKGAVSLYGIGRFPVTLYMDQWRAVLEEKESILAFIEENKDNLMTLDKLRAARAAEAKSAVGQALDCAKEELTDLKRVSEQNSSSGD